MKNEKHPPFEGFPADLPDFLWGIALNNDKTWFEAHRDDYERCLHGPVKALTWQVLEALGEKYPREPLSPHISRIYRDARTLRGRGPLNDHMWFSIGRTGRVYSLEPQFFFGVEARCCTWGLGFWNAGAEVMDRWRKSIDVNPRRLARIVGTVNRMEGMERYGETYKRPKGDPGALLFDWYNTKMPGVSRTLWFDDGLPGPELAGIIASDFIKLMPLYRYLAELCGD